MKIYSGTIITCSKTSQIHKYLIENDGNVIFTGDELPEQYRNYPVADYANKAITPAFGDSHIHFGSFSLFNSDLMIRDVNSIADIQSLLKNYASKNHKDFIFGFGLSPHNVKEKRMLLKTEIDAILPDKAVCIVKYDGHACIINSKMMASIPKHMHSLRGFHADTGEINHEAFFAVLEYLTKKISLLQNIKQMLSGVDYLATQGIGLIHTVSGVGFPMDLDVDAERLFAKLQKNPLQMRLYFQTLDVKKVLKRGLPRIGGCFATALDGCFGSLDAALNAPYIGSSENKGILFYDDNKVTSFMKRANRAGLQVSMHAIGDAAFDQATRCFDAALKDYPREDHRHTIIHACLPTERGLEICARNNITFSVQPVFLNMPEEPVSYLHSIIGDRAYNMLPLRKMIDMGITLSGGSDAPVSMPNPLNTIHEACNHYVSSQSVSVQEALNMVTRNVAWQSFDDKIRGSLEPGKKADMVILSKNPLSLASNLLKTIKVEQLFLEGKEYQPGQSISNLLLRSFLLPFLV